MREDRSLDKKNKFIWIWICYLGGAVSPEEYVKEKVMMAQLFLQYSLSLGQTQLIAY